MTKPPIHTVPTEDGWANRREGAARASSIHETQAEAIRAARATAAREKTEHFIHGENGRIRERNSYGNDPEERKG